MTTNNCAGCKHVREHVASLLPFKVIESVAGKHLRIGGVAMTVGMSRNFNVYTPEELAFFADKLVNAPVYIEHVDVASAAGKVTKCIYDAASRCLLYEAEIYDQTIADKIRNGLIQHVSVGADYDALDVVDAKVPHGLFNPELSLVAVPGIPETNVQVLEPFASEKRGVERLEEKDIENISEKVAAKIGEKSSLEVEKLKIEFSEAKAKLAVAEGKVKVAEGACVEANGKLTAANKTVEDLKKLMPGVDLLKDPPVLMAVSEALADFRSLRLSPMVENCSGFSQHMGMDIRNKILKYEAKLRAK
jgi:hypothetical protein